jgi:hypothetical protein
VTLAKAPKRAEEIQEILTQACARRELLIIATPYLRFESSFVALNGDELHVLATMSREDAAYGLRSAPLKIRFPNGLGFLEAPVEMRGLGIHEGRRTLRLSIPAEMRENDQRVAYRVERVGRVLVTYGTSRGEILQASLVDISVTGARLHAQRDAEVGLLRPGATLALSIPLSPEIQIEARGEVRHLGARTIGVRFDPRLPLEVEAPLSRWIFLRREEDRERLALRREHSDRGGRLALPGAPPEAGILFLSADAELSEALGEILEPIQPLTRVPLSLQGLKDGLAASPALLIVQVPALGLDERRRLKALVEHAQGRAPILLLGTGVDGASLFELSGEWKASSAMAWNPDRALFLQRLAQGIIRRHRHGGDGPMAPAEP